VSPEQLQQLTDMKVAIDTVWVIVAACMVFLMQAGFAMLEVGFSRGKNVGAVVAKILVNLSIGTVAFWAVGFGLAFGSGNEMFGTDGFFLHNSLFDSLSFSAVPLSAKFLFEVVFCTVSLAIVWGTMLDRTKFAVYVVFAVIFAAVIYPLVGHWIWGGGFLADLGMQDFAGSTVVHLCGATAALAGTLLLGARIGKFDAKGKAHPIPGHSMPLAILGVLILWFGWFGFNPGSTLGAVGARFADIAVTTNLAAAAGVLGAIIAGYLLGRTIDIGFAGNGAIAGLVAITAPCAYVDQWAACVIGLIAGILMVSTVVAVDKLRVDDPIGAIAGHGMGGIWGTLSCGLFTTSALAKTNGVGDPGLFYGGGVHQLGVQALGIAAVFAFVFISSAAVFYACKKTIGLRVNAQQELEGLDIHEHGMWGYPEQFLPGYGATQPYVLAPNRRPQAPAGSPVTAYRAISMEGGD
jgi:ammonium transporter, Amt family